jgi:hypothetical protein
MEIHIIDWLLYIILTIIYIKHTEEIVKIERIIGYILLSLIYMVIFYFFDVMEILTNIWTVILYITQSIFDNVSIKI